VHHGFRKSRLFASKGANSRVEYPEVDEAPRFLHTQIRFPLAGPPIVASVFEFDTRTETCRALDTSVLE
jgi:hypothetical protein